MRDLADHVALSVRLEEDVGVVLFPLHRAASADSLREHGDGALGDVDVDADVAAARVHLGERGVPELAIRAVYGAGDGLEVHPRVRLEAILAGGQISKRGDDGASLTQPHALGPRRLLGRLRLLFPRRFPRFGLDDVPRLRRFFVLASIAVPAVAARRGSRVVPTSPAAVVEGARPAHEPRGGARGPHGSIAAVVAAVGTVLVALREVRLVRASLVHPVGRRVQGEPLQGVEIAEGESAGRGHDAPRAPLLGQADDVGGRVDVRFVVGGSEFVLEEPVDEVALLAAHLETAPLAHRLELRGGHLLELGAALRDGELAVVRRDADGDASVTMGGWSGHREPGAAEDAGIDERNRIGVTPARSLALAAVVRTGADDSDLGTTSRDRSHLGGARAMGDGPHEQTRDRCRLHERPGACVRRDAAHWPSLRCPSTFSRRRALFYPELRRGPSGA